MPPLDDEKIKEFISRYLPASISDNPFVSSLAAGAAAIGILVATPAFAPIGVVGATGWVIVYLVTGGTFSMELVRRAWKRWNDMSESERKAVDDELERLKKLHDSGGLDDEEYKRRVKEVLDRSIK